MVNLNALTLQVIRVLQHVKGVEAAQVVQKIHHSKILKKESLMEYHLSNKAAAWRNEGLRDVLKRNVITSISHNSGLRHPPGPTVVLISGGIILGEEVWKKDKILEFKKNSGEILIGKNFVLHKDTLKARSLRRPIFVFPSLPFPEVEVVDGVKDVASASLSVSTDIFIKEIMGWSHIDPTLATVLIGFNA